MAKAKGQSDHRPLSIGGSLSVSGPNGAKLRVRGVGERLEVDLDRSLLSFRLLAQLPSRRTRWHWLRRGQSALDLAQVSIDILVDGHAVGRYGGKSRASLLSRLLGLGPLEIRIRPLLMAFARRAPTNSGG